MLEKHLIAQTNPAARPENVIVTGDLRITVLTDCLLRIEKSENLQFCDEATQSIWFRNLPPVSFRTEQTSEGFQVITDQVCLVLKKEIPESYLIFSDSKEKVFLNNEGSLLGTYRTLDCCDGDMWIPFNDGEPGAHPIELDHGVVSKNGVAVIDDSASLLLKADGTLSPRDFEETDLYIFAYGKNFRGAVRALYQLCGKTPLIPRFALGNWWSRYYAYTEKEYLQLMDRFAARKVPFTVATIDMDWHWSETLDEAKGITRDGKNDDLHGGNNGWTGYSWNTDLFPDYRRFLQKLHERNLCITLNHHPAQGVRYFEDFYEEMARAMGVDPKTEVQIPFDISSDRYINAYFEVLHRPYEKDGVDFWWIDWQQGSESSMEGLDPLWALNHYHYLDNGLFHHPLILSRYCGIGSHRYPLGFSGDTLVTWKTLKYLPYFTATASNVGYTWWSHDIGGHMLGYKDDELYVRFLQFGVFSPINRMHSTSCLTFTKEPWAYMGGTGLIAEEFLRLRHRMIPFLYSASYENTDNGLALIEPMYYAYPEKSEAYECPDQYLFGGQLLVAPATEKAKEEGMSRIPVWLPDGRWTDLFTGDEYQGGCHLTMVRWLDSIPVLLKEGGFFVLDNRETTNDWTNPEKLKVIVSRGTGSYTLHEDLDGERIDTLLESRAVNDNQQKLTLTCQTKASLPVRSFLLEFCNITTGEVQAVADGKEISVLTDDNGRLTVCLEQVLPGTVYEILVTFEDEAQKKREEAVRQTITRLQTGNNAKNDLYDRLRTADRETYRTLTEQAALSETAKLRLMEHGFSSFF